MLTRLRYAAAWRQWRSSRRCTPSAAPRRSPSCSRAARRSGRPGAIWLAFLLLVSCGGVLAVRPSLARRVDDAGPRRPWRQPPALFVVARESGADSPYLARKMAHFAVCRWRRSRCCRWRAVPLLVRARRRWSPGGRLRRLRWTAWIGLDVAVRAWTLELVDGAAIAARDYGRHGSRRSLGTGPRAAGLYRLPGRSDDTSYWLHHAVIGNPDPSAARVGAPVLYRDALMRWIAGSGLPCAIADLAIVPREVRDDLESLARFGYVAVGRSVAPPRVLGTETSPLACLGAPELRRR